MWKEFIQSVSKDCQFKESAKKQDIERIQKELNVEFPEELLSVLNETNGVFDQWGCALLWSTSRILEDNQFFRNFTDYHELYMPFDNLLFFSDAGNGDLFCFAIAKNGCIEKTDIYVWNHVEDSRMWVASSLEHFLEGLITGKISV